MMTRTAGLILGLILTSSGWGHGLSGKKFRFQYENEDHYRMVFSDDAVTWTGVKGSDLGKSETDAVRVSAVEPQIYFVNWEEKDGTFVTLAVNLKAMKVWGSGKSKEVRWFNQGKILEER